MRHEYCSWHGVDDWVTNTVQSMGYFGVLLLMALENVFPPIPSELIMPLTGYSAAQGKLNLWLAVLVGSLGTLVGTLPWYGLARLANKQRFYRWVEHHGHWLTLERSDLERAERWFGHRGNWIVAVGRLVPGVRTLISVPAGFCRMPLGTYLAYSAAGTLIWTGVLAYLGHLLGRKYTQVSDYLGLITWGVLGVIFLVYSVRLVRMRQRNHARRARAAQDHS